MPRMPTTHAHSCVYLNTHLIHKARVYKSIYISIYKSTYENWTVALWC